MQGKYGKHESHVIIALTQRGKKELACSLVFQKGIFFLHEPIFFTIPNKLCEIPNLSFT